MKDYTRSFSRVAALVFTLALFCSLAAAQSNTLSGSFGFLLNDSGGLAVLGVMNFDGAGNVTGSYTGRSNGGHPQSPPGTFTGTYSSMPNGVGVKPGSVTIALDIGVTDFAGHGGHRWRPRAPIGCNKRRGRPRPRRSCVQRSRQSRVHRFRERLLRIPTQQYPGSECIPRCRELRRRGKRDHVPYKR